MELVKIKIWLVALPAVLLISGCSSLPKSSSLKHPEASAGQLFLTPAPSFESSEFSKRWAGTITEQDKIRYLLERIGASSNHFIRNGEVHSGAHARQWLLYKLGHWVSGVDTAEDFVIRAASFSQKTGRPYLVQSAEGKSYSLKSFLKNELSAFEKYRFSITGLAQEMVPNPSRVSLSTLLAARNSR